MRKDYEIILNLIPENSKDVERLFVRLKTILNIMVNFGERIYSRWKTIKREKRLPWNSTTGSSKLDCLQKTSIRNRLKKFGDGLFCKNIMCLAPTGHTS